MSQEVVHVHDLRPSLPVSDLHLVFEVGNHLGFSRKCPNETSSVRSRYFLGWTYADVGLMYFGRGFVDGCYEEFDEAVHLGVVVVVVGDFKGVIEENMSCNNVSFIGTLAY